MINKIVSILFFLFGLLSLNAQDLSIATKDSIHSNILDEDRSIWVSLPQGYNEKEIYPVLYLLDGTTNLYATHAVTQQLANEYIPPMIIVAITNKSQGDRDENMTPYDFMPEEDSRIYGLYAQFQKMGGGEKFVSFIKDELIPYIDTKYATASYQIISGHSQSGNLALYASMTHPETFQACIAADPSVWFANGRIINELKDGSQYKRSRWYIGIANAFDMTSDEIRMDTTNFGLFHTKFIFTLVDRPNDSNYTGLEFNSNYYLNESHFSVPLITTFDGLRFIFKAYPDQTREDQNLFYTDDPATAIDSMEKRYAILSEMYGFKLVKRESMLNQIGYGFLNRKQMEAAGKCFELNIRFHPYSQNVYDSYGDYFIAVGNKEKAIEQFKKALEIKESPATRKKLEELLKKE